ncbi:MAG TPA: hypothetical protein VFZ75_05605 [Actinomycetota bacterium]|nr:hypothetical protein [Actinomycetota bacterium]
MNRNTAIDGTEETVCAACARIPLAHLALDVDPPLGGWQQFFHEAGVAVSEDDLGRPSIPRSVLGDLLADDREREARLAAQRAEQATAPVPAGVPALDGATAYESMAAAGIVTPRQEFGGGRTTVYQELLDERLAEGRRQEADARAEREAIDRAKQLLDGGRDKAPRRAGEE